MSLPNTRDLAFGIAKKEALTTGNKALYESLVLQYTNPQMEWGRNNIKDLVTLFHMSGQTNEQIYNILYNMGVEKDRAYSAIQMYIPQKNKIEMTVKESLNFNSNFRTLVDKMGELKRDDSANYNIDAVINVCENYMNFNKENMSTSDLASFAKNAITELNKFDYISAVKECIKTIEDSMFESILSIEVDSLSNELSNSNVNNSYNNVIDRLNSLKSMNESEIKENIATELSVYSGWIPQVKTLLEKVEVVEGTKVDKVKSLNENFDLKGRIKDLSESLKSESIKNSENIIKNALSICERYLSELYSGSTVSESNLAGNFYKELVGLNWIKCIKESLDSILTFMNENFMSFEVNNTLTLMENSKNSSFYGPALEKLRSIKSLSESEIRDEIKYGMNNLNWVPEIKYLLETLNNLEGNLSSNENVILEKKYTPFFENDGKSYFYLSGSVYELNESTIVAVDPYTIPALYLTLIAVTEKSHFDVGTLTYNKNNNRIDLKLNEDSKKFSLNGKQFDINESKDLKSILLNTNTFRINETSELDMIVKAYENLEKFSELDFVDSIKSRTFEGLVANVIRLGENIYINKVNTNMQQNELVLAESASDASSIVLEHIGYDISPLLVDLLEGEKKDAAILEAKKNDIYDKIQFLNEQREKLSAYNSDNESINAADSLIRDEINKFQKELNEISK